MLFDALTVDAKHLIAHLSDEQLADEKAGHTIFDILVNAHKHVTVNEDQDDFDHAVFGAQRDNSKSLIQFANECQSLFLKSDQHGDALPDRRKGMIFLRKARNPPHQEDHILAIT